VHRDKPVDRLDHGMRDADFDRGAVGHESGSSVTRTCLKRTGTAVRVSMRRLIDVMSGVCRVAVAHEVGDVLGHLAGPGRDCVCQ